MIWHSSSVTEVLNELGVDEKQGLSNSVADERYEKYGGNVISKIKKPLFKERFFQQFKNKTTIALIIIAIISMILSIVYKQENAFSGLLIIAIVVINSLISAYHIYSCDKSFENIKQVTNPTVTVLREGILKCINAANLVKGDIILLESGDYIPADARVIDSNEFRCNESVLTGIEVPVEKSADSVFDDITTVDKRGNMVFTGCSVVHGTAKAVVCETGLNTELGRSSALTQQAGEDKLPLETQLKNIGKIVNTVILIACVGVFLLGLIQNFSAENFADMTLKMLLNAVALAVAAMPEGLTAITSIVIAIGVSAIIRDKIIIKDASAAELLGKTDVICCDKTGVFTRNKMSLTHIFNGKKIIDITKEGIDEYSSTILKFATACSTLKNDSTEDAIEKASLAYNSLSRNEINGLFPQISIIPFSSERKCMTVITMINEQPFAIVKGAAEILIPKCVDCDCESLLKINEAMASEGLRIVCIGMKPLSSIPANPNFEEIEKELTFIGLLGLNDPPREDIQKEIEACKAAGIKVVMVTGDNLETAKMIAKSIGILSDETEAISGEELSKIDDNTLASTIEKYSVFARISPSDKIRIVKAWQSNKKIITITGDSVNDADALALADVGCAIGKYGADVAKGNADIIIENNRFDSVVRAVKESRGMFNNIKKSVSYLFSCNFAEILCIILGMLIFGVAPIAAVPLLWINLLTDCAPSISLSTERAEDNVMNSKQISSFGRIFNRYSVLSILLQGLFITAISLISYSIGNDFGDSVTASTMTFATLGISQIFHCFNNKYDGSLFNKELFSNVFMNISVGLTLFIMVFLIFTPAGHLFGLTVLSFKEFIICLALSIAIIPFCELLKFAIRHRPMRVNN